MPGRKRLLLNDDSRLIEKFILRPTLTNYSISFRKKNNVIAQFYKFNIKLN